MEEMEEEPGDSLILLLLRVGSTDKTAPTI
jgi:hypothetical protein